MRRSARLGASLLLVLSLSSCRHEERAPAPSPSASTLGRDFSALSRERHFLDELARARARHQTQPRLANCAGILKEAADLQLCQTAIGALTEIAGEPAATPEQSIERLAAGALSLARLSERVRYLSLAELAERPLEGDAGARAAPSASAGTAEVPAAVSHGRKTTRQEPGSGHHEPHGLELRDGPISQLLAVTLRSQRDAIRELGAYLEYGPLPVRRTAFAAVKRLHAEHPKWPLLDHLLQEAALLEADGALKHDLQQLSGSGSPRGERPAQSDATK